MTSDALAELAIEPGTKIGPYRVDSFLARGGMGVVVRAVDENLGRPVAIKIIDPRLGNDTEFQERFRRECRVLAAIRHPNIVTIYYQDVWKGAPFFAMELVGGFSLDRVLRDMKGLDWRTAAGWMRQCMEALEAARGEGILHRDLKPANILIDEASEVRIVDFGLAKQEEVSKDLTATNVFLGTPHYVSPEQAMGQVLDWRADLYSLGATFYRVFSGQPVFDAPSVPEIVAAHIRQPHRPLKEVAPDLPAPVCALVDRMLAKAPEARALRSYREVLKSLEDAVAAASEARGIAAQATVVAELGSDTARVTRPPEDQPSTGRHGLAPGTDDDLETRLEDLSPDPPLFAWLMPLEPEGAPEVALLRDRELPFGSRSDNPIVIPDDPRNRRISRVHGRLEWTPGGYALRVIEGRKGRPPPACRLGGAVLPVGLHDLSPGARVELRAGVTLTVDGASEDGLRVAFEAAEGTKAHGFVGKWYWVLVHGGVLAGAGTHCGVHLPGEGVPEEAFRLVVREHEVLVAPVQGELRVGGESVTGERVLAPEDVLEGPGYRLRFRPAASARELWEV